MKIAAMGGIKKRNFTFKLKDITKKNLDGRTVGLLKPMLALQCFGDVR
jgi:hypothetical protein